MALKVDDRVVVLRRVPWAQYDALCRATEDSAGPRMAFLDSELEVASCGRQHAHETKLISRLIEAYADELELSLNSFGSETLRKKTKAAGVEPDECYCVGHARAPPDFAIEVEFANRGINKPEIYRRLGVGEVWRWEGERFTVFRLTRRGYVSAKRSAVLPELDLEAIAAIVRTTGPADQSEAVRSFRRRLRRS